MNLSDIIQRGIPQPWSEGDNIPWNEPGFSERMLKEHLAQDHDAASRRLATVERHVGFIQQRVLGGKEGKPAQVLDLGCGPVTRRTVQPSTRQCSKRLVSRMWNSSLR
jgi:hypothetical protein